MNKLKQILISNYNKKIAIMGMGNTLKADDGAGSILAKRLKNGINAFIIDAEITPENYLGVITKFKPDLVIILDVVYFDSPPGTIDVFDCDSLSSFSFSTHGMSPAFLRDYLVEYGISNIVLVGIQPQNITLGDSISHKVRQAISEIENTFLEILSK
jgi:hydrogenase 3 maturation protease